jgi:hypothetical protein
MLSFITRAAQIRGVPDVFPDCIPQIEGFPGSDFPWNRRASIDGSIRNSSVYDAILQEPLLNPSFFSLAKKVRFSVEHSSLKLKNREEFPSFTSGVEHLYFLAEGVLTSDGIGQTFVQNT